MRYALQIDNQIVESGNNNVGFSIPCLVKYGSFVFILIDMWMEGDHYACKIMSLTNMETININNLDLLDPYHGTVILTQ